MGELTNVVFYYWIATTSVLIIYAIILFINSKLTKNTEIDNELIKKGLILNENDIEDNPEKKNSIDFNKNDNTVTILE